MTFLPVGYDGQPTEDRYSAAYLNTLDTMCFKLIAKRIPPDYRMPVTFCPFAITRVSIRQADLAERAAALAHPLGDDIFAIQVRCCRSEN